MNFTFNEYRKVFEVALEHDYQVTTLERYLKDSVTQKVLLNRIDIDLKPEKTFPIIDIFRDLNIKGTFFLRLNSPTYNLFEYSVINLVHSLLNEGHEIGLHTELVDLEKICGIDGKNCLEKEISVVEKFFDCKIVGTASHGDHTGHNNMLFWDNYKPRDFNLLYEAYEKKLLQDSRYIADSQWTSWKAYQNTKIIDGDNRTPIEHITEDKPNKIYLLTHPDCYYHNNFHERSLYG